MAPWWLSGWAVVLLLLLAQAIAFVWLQRRFSRRNRELEGRGQEGAEALARANRALEEASQVDPLTGLHNRRFLETYLDTDAHQAQRVFSDLLAAGGDPQAAREDLVLFLLDLDHLEKVNATWGRAAGDAVLKQLARRLGRITRKTDFRVRWQDGTILLVARRSRRSGAVNLARKLLEEVRELAFQLPGGEVIRERLCIGFTAFPLHPRQPDLGTWRQAVGLADQCLKAAKGSGRDRWVGAMLVPEADPGPLRGRAQWDLPWAQAQGLVRVDCSEEGFVWPAPR